MHWRPGRVDAGSIAVDLGIAPMLVGVAVIPLLQGQRRDQTGKGPDNADLAP